MCSATLSLGGVICCHWLCMRSGKALPAIRSCLRDPGMFHVERASPGRNLQAATGTPQKARERRHGRASTQSKKALVPRGTGGPKSPRPLVRHLTTSPNILHSPAFPPPRPETTARLRFLAATAGHSSHEAYGRPPADSPSQFHISAPILHRQTRLRAHPSSR